MWTRQLLKENGRIAFLRNYWTCVIVSALASVLASGSIGINLGYNANTEVEDGAVEELLALWKQVPYEIIITIFVGIIIGALFALLFSVFCGNVILVGRNRYFMENREHKTEIACLFYGFQGARYKKTVKVMFVKDIFVFIATLFFVIPGIIMSYQYMLVPYIAAENVHMDRKRMFALSKQMMEGHKMEAFELDFSFIGWYLLGGVSGGLVNVFYTAPYVCATFTEFYTALKSEALQKGILMPNELPGVIEPEVEIPIV